MSNPTPRVWDRLDLFPQIPHHKLAPSWVIPNLSHPLLCLPCFEYVRLENELFS